MNFIKRYDNLVPVETCEGMISLFKDADKRKLTNAGMTGKVIDKKRKDSVDLPHHKITPKLREKYNDVLTNYFEVLQQAQNQYHDEFEQLKYPKTYAHGVYQFQIQRYYPGGQAYHAWHYESGHPRVANRLLAFITYLNTVEKGGETEFIYQKVKAKPEQGLTMIWPAGFTHTHRGLPAPDEVKFIITGWFEWDPALFASVGR